MKIGLDLAEIYRIFKNVYLFVCLFVELFVFFNHVRTPTIIYPEHFVKIGLDLAEIHRILKMFICLFVCLFVDLFVFFILNILGHPKEYTLKIL